MHWAKARILPISIIHGLKAMAIESCNNYRRYPLML